MTGRIHHTKVAQFVGMTNGKFMTVFFITKDGRQRKLNGRTGVKRHLKGGHNPVAEDMSRPYIVVWDRQALDYRHVNLDTIHQINYAGLNLRVY